MNLHTLLSQTNGRSFSTLPSPLFDPWYLLYLSLVSQWINHNISILKIRFHLVSFRILPCQLDLSKARAFVHLGLEARWTGQLILINPCPSMRLWVLTSGICWISTPLSLPHQKISVALHLSRSRLIYRSAYRWLT